MQHLIDGLTVDWQQRVRSRTWRATLREEMKRWGDYQPAGSITDGSVIDFVSGVVDGSLHCSNNLDLYDGLCWLACRHREAFRVAFLLQVVDSAGWLRTSRVGDMDDFCSYFTEFLLLELKFDRMDKPYRWAARNIQRNARYRTLYKTRLENKKNRQAVDDSEKVFPFLADEPDEISFDRLLDEVIEISEQSKIACAHTVLFYGYGFTMSQLTAATDALTAGQIEYGFRKVFESYNKNSGNFSG